MGSEAKKLKRLPCQVCGRQLTLRRDGLVKPHKRRKGLGWDADYCPGTGYRHDRWPVAQRLLHHSGSEWVILAAPGGQFGDYRLRCVSTDKAFSDQELGREMVAHGEYMHRHGWTPINDDCVCGHGFDRHDHRRIGAPCRDCDEPLECTAYEPDLTVPTQQAPPMPRAEIPEEGE